MQNSQSYTNFAAAKVAEPEVSLFEKEVLEGLNASEKKLPSKYFYDQKGDALFQQIMELPDYYLTRAELQVLQENAHALLGYFSENNQPFQLIELGAGDGLKTKVLLHSFLSANARFTYVPIDISENAVQKLTQELVSEIPALEIDPLVLDYFQGLDQLSSKSKVRKVVLFLGSSIGNMTNEEAVGFLSELNAHLSPGDLLLTGFDLVKSPDKILDAYNDSSGVTAAFNLNLLQRMNSELGTDFDVSSFRHFALYDPLVAEARSYLISTKKQEVYFPASAETIAFDAWEAIHTEISAKYTKKTTNKMAEASGFKVVQHFTDSKDLFLDALWQKK